MRSTGCDKQVLRLRAFGASLRMTIPLCMQLLWLIVCSVVAVSHAAAQTATRQDALALEQQGRNAEAEQIWSSIAERDTRNAEALAHLGLLQARQEHYDEAIADYRRALAIDPAFPALKMNLGLALFKTDQFGDAIKAFGAELEKYPGDLRLITLLGMAHYAMGDYLVAIPYLQKATESDAQNAALTMTLAHSCLWSRQYACAVKSANQVLAQNPGAAETAVLAGEALDAEGDTAAAIEQFRAAIRANPNQPDAHFGLGYLLWEHGESSVAIAEFHAELGIDPANAEAQASLTAAANSKKPVQPLIEVIPSAQPPAKP
jgi:tetratricopeptide (TPR) repeat protein